MLTRRHLVTFVMGLFVAVSIGSNCETTKPPEGPGTAYPCGIWGVECPDGVACCPYNHECGGFKGEYFETCPKDYCCAVNDNWPRIGAAGDGGLERSMVKAKPRSGR